ncbi:hypothetical protein ACIQCM_11535 [Pseudarthrobacter sp. NPDC092439]|uniref:hypothetical protein n=1 Tax=unclassified Pseudarthrobacter TaxID=2647000 RepID=UPI0038093F01
MLFFTAVLLMFTVGISAAQAASPHFKRGGSPVCEVSAAGSTSTTTCTAVLAGLGNEDLVATVTVAGYAVYECQNYGGNVAPGQNKVVTGPVTEPTSVPSDAIKNGTLRLATDPVTLSAPDTATAAEAGCPNGNWQGINPVLTVTSIQLTITQGTFSVTCWAYNENGLTGSVALTC